MDVALGHVRGTLEPLHCRGGLLRPELRHHDLEGEFRQWRRYVDVRTAGATLVQVNGLKVLFVLLVPLVFAESWRSLSGIECARAGGTGVISWTIAGLVAAFCLLGALSIGPFFSTVAIFMFVAVLRVHNRSRPNSLAQVPVVATPPLM